MSKKALYLIFSHDLTAGQEENARLSLGVERVVSMPQEIADIWRQVPPELASLKAYLAPIVGWVEKSAAPGDYVLIQGDFGACWLLVQTALDRGIVPVYATTRREVSETHRPDGSVEVTRKFRHVMFRRYGV